MECPQAEEKKLDHNEQLAASAIVWGKKNCSLSTILFQWCIIPWLVIYQEVRRRYPYFLRLPHPDHGAGYPEMPLLSPACKLRVSCCICKPWGSLAPPAILLLWFIPLESEMGIPTRKHLQWVGGGRGGALNQRASKIIEKKIHPGKKQGRYTHWRSF